MAINFDPKVANAALPGQAAARSTDALDFKQFAALRRGAEANDPKVLREAARQFESLFTKMLFENMRKASLGDDMFSSDQLEQYQSMMDDQMAVQLSSGKGLGLADMLIRQLSQNGQVGQGGQGAVAQVGDGAANKVDDAQRAKFVNDMLPHATAAARELGVDPRGLIAQAALETGWGTANPADSNGASHNFFGIKAGASWNGASVSSDTTEYVEGAPRTERAQFRAYGSLAENMADYVHVIRDNPRYAAALNTGTDVHAFATALQRGGYATDPAYAQKLVAIAAGLPLAAHVNSFKSADATPIANAEPSRMDHA